MSSFDLLFGISLSVLGVVAAICIMAFGGSDRDVLLVLCLSLLVFGWTLALVYSQQKADHWLSQFPGPVTISAPLWHRVLLCLTMIMFGCFPTFGGVILSIKRGNWEIVQAIVVCILGLCCAICAFCLLQRYELVLRLDKLEYRSPWGRHSYRWSEFSKFYVFGARWRYIFCQFTPQPDRHWSARDGLTITAPMGVSKYVLRELLISWQARALANQSARAASRAATSDPIPRKRSLLDYA